MTGVVASTVTDSDWFPTCMRKSALVTLLTATCTLRVVVLKPDSVAVTVYTQTGSSARRNPPALSVVADRESPLATQSAQTSAPDTPPQVESVTAPEMEHVR